MALTFKIDASAGNIWTDIISDNGQAIDLAIMDLYVASHSHGGDTFFLNSVTELRTNMEVLLESGHGACTPRCAVNGAGDSAAYDRCLPIANRNHSHANDDVAASGTTATTARTVKANNEVFIASDGEVTCDQVCDQAGADCLCPYVMYGKFDDHTHTLAGDFALNVAYAPIQIADDDSTTTKWFHIAKDATDSLNDAVWDEAQTHGYGPTAQHVHAAGGAGMSLAAYAAAAGSTGDRGGAKSWWVTHANGHMYVTHDVNGIGLEAFYDLLYGAGRHIHTPIGSSASYGPTYAQVFSKNNGDTYSWFETSAGVYQELVVESLAHTHTLDMS